MHCDAVKCGRRRWQSSVYPVGTMDMKETNTLRDCPIVWSYFSHTELEWVRKRAAKLIPELAQKHTVNG